jgi:hypothetical protein
MLRDNLQRQPLKCQFKGVHQIKQHRKGRLQTPNACRTGSVKSTAFSPAETGSPRRLCRELQVPKERGK